MSFEMLAAAKDCTGMKKKLLKSTILLVLAVLALASCAVAAWEAGETVGAVGAALSELDESTYGSAECDLGSYTADAVRYSLGADVAIVNSGDLAEDFPHNVVSIDDIRGVFANDRVLALTAVTADELCRIIEGALSHITVDRQREAIDREASSFGGFPQISGMELVYDGSAMAGERIYRLELSDGRVIRAGDTETVITLAATEFMLSGGWGYDAEVDYKSADITLSGAVAQYIENGEISFSGGRISAIGVNDNFIARSLPKGLLPVVIAVLIVFFLFVRLRFRDIKHNVYFARDPDEGRPIQVRRG